MRLLGERNRTGDLLLSLKRGGVRRQGAGGIGRRIGLLLGGGGRGFGTNTEAAVTSCPSNWPPSICFTAFSESSGFSYSTYANPRERCELILSGGISTFLTVPKAEKISIMWSRVTFLVNLPT